MPKACEGDELDEPRGTVLPPSSRIRYFGGRRENRASGVSQWWNNGMVE